MYAKLPGKARKGALCSLKIHRDLKVLSIQIADILTSNAVGKVNLLMHEGIAKTWEAWKVACEK